MLGIVYFLLLVSPLFRKLGIFFSFFQYSTSFTVKCFVNIFRFACISASPKYAGYHFFLRMNIKYKYFVLLFFLILFKLILQQVYFKYISSFYYRGASQTCLIIYLSFLLLLSQSFPNKSDDLSFFSPSISWCTPNMLDTVTFSPPSLISVLQDMLHILSFFPPSVLHCFPNMLNILSFFPLLLSQCSPNMLDILDFFPPSLIKVLPKYVGYLIFSFFLHLAYSCECCCGYLMYMV